MNISAYANLAALDYSLAALKQCNHGQREHEEVLYVLYGMRSAIENDYFSIPLLLRILTSVIEGHPCPVTQ
jgi:hypothetical protein